MRTAAVALALGLLGSTALAQSPRYEPWQGQPDQQTRSLLEELDTLIDRAERDNAASPDFLRDLRALEQRYGGQAAAAGQNQARSRTTAADIVVADDFRDGNYTANPAWTVLRGDWGIFPDTGLRSDLTGRAGGRTAGRGEQPSPQSMEGLAMQVLGTVLSQQAGERQPQGATPTGDEVAAIELEQRLPNAVQLDMVVSDQAGQGQLEMRLYQTSSRDPGYRLVYRPDMKPSLALYRVSQSGISLVAEADRPVTLPVGEQHRIVWARDANGQMSVTVDGRLVLEATDRGFRDPWTGFMLVNTGGDFALRSITARENA